MRVRNKKRTCVDFREIKITRDITMLFCPYKYSIYKFDNKYQW